MEQNGRIDNPIISLDHVSKRFESAGRVKEVVNDVSLDVKANEFVVLFGPGQCGKTTMINLIAGLEPASEGTVTVDGKKSGRTWGRPGGLCIRPQPCSHSAQSWEMWSLDQSPGGLIKRREEKGHSILSIW